MVRKIKVFNAGSAEKLEKIVNDWLAEEFKFPKGLSTREDAAQTEKTLRRLRSIEWQYQTKTYSYETREGGVGYDHSYSVALFYDLDETKTE